MHRRVQYMSAIAKTKENVHVGSCLRALLGSSVVAARPPDLCVMSAETPPPILTSRESHSAHSLHPPAVAVLRDRSRPGPD